MAPKDKSSADKVVTPPSKIQNELSESQLRQMADAFGDSSKLASLVRKATPVTPPPIWQEFLRIRGDCDVDLDDPDLVKLLTQALPNK